MYREPKSAKRLYFDVIPRKRRRLPAIPRRLFRARTPRQQLANPVWHIHAGHPPKSDMPVTFQLLLTLGVVFECGKTPQRSGVFIGRYRPGVTPQTHAKLDAMVGYAINYYRDFVAPTKKIPRADRGAKRAALQDLRDALSKHAGGGNR